jgi:phage terminase large subunit GpA-like protein
MPATVDIPNPPAAPEWMQRGFALRPELSLVEFARAHCYATEGPLVETGIGENVPVPFDPATFPLQLAPLEAIGDPRWSRVVVMTAPQAFGKTEALAKPALMYALEYRGISAAYVAGRQALAAGQWKKKILPAMLADADLAALIPENPDEGGDKNQRNFTNGTSLHFAGSESEAALSGFTALVIVCDDVHAMPQSIPGRGHPVDIAFTRSESAPAESCTHVQIGTAGTVEDYHWQTLVSSALYCPFVPCPGCGTYQLLEWERMEFDHEDIGAALTGTWLRCANPDCEHPIVFDELDAMLAEHRWVSLPPGCDWLLNPPEGGSRWDPAEPGEFRVYPSTARNTNHAGFWCNALYWPHGKSWGQIAAEYISCRGDPDKPKNFGQQKQTRPWKEPEVDEQRLTVEELQTHVVEGYAARTVPAAADLVTVTVDVQSGYIYYIVRAWKKADGTSWLIDAKTIGKPVKGGGDSEAELRARRAAGIITGMDELDALVATGWPVVDAEGEIKGTISARVGLIDRGFEPEIVAGWWSAKHRNVWKMIKGQKAGQRAVLWPLHRREGLRTDARNRPWRLVDINAAKHVLRRLLRVAAGQPGYWHIPGSGLHVNTIRSYYRHLTSEKWRKDLAPPRWKKITEGLENHYLDCETYQISAARACGVQLVGFEATRSARKSPARRPAKEQPRRTR